VFEKYKNVLQCTCFSPSQKEKKNNNLLSSSWQTFLGPSVQAVLAIIQTIWHRFRRLHIKLARTARALKAWKKNCIGNVKLKLEVAKEARPFDQAQERKKPKPN
jgi:hypothetical protein